MIQQDATMIPKIRRLGASFSARSRDNPTAIASDRGVDVCFKFEDLPLISTSKR